MKKTNLLKKHLPLVLLYIAALIDVCYNQPFIVRCILLALMIVVTFTDDFIFSVPLIAMLNDGLGTAFGSHVSFYWVMVVLIIVKSIFDRNFFISQRAILFVVLSILYSIFLIIIQYDMDPRMPMNMFSYFLMFIYITEQVERGKVTLKSIALALSIAIMIAAIQMAFFGGVNYTTLTYESSNDEWTQTARYGLIGAGAGDPNYSGLILLFGLICLWSSNIKKILKPIISVLFLYCIVKTVSITTLLVFLLIVLFSLAIQRGINRKLKAFLGILFGIILVYILIIRFPIGDISEQLSLYYYRLQSKLNFLSTGNISELTTGRTSEAMENIEYAFSRNFSQFLVGLDAFPVSGLSLPHNTYVDVLINFGIIGAIIYIVAIIKRFVSVVKEHHGVKVENKNLILCLKVLFITFSFALSLHSGIMTALLVWVLLVL